MTSKSFKQKRKEKRNTKRELKNHTNTTYTEDSIKEALRQIRLAQNEIIRQNKEKQDQEQKRLAEIKKAQEPISNVKLKSTTFVKHYSSRPSDPTKPVLQEKPIYFGSDGHVHSYRERSETEVYCDTCGDIQLKQDILYFEITPSIHKVKGVVQKNTNPQRYFAPLLAVAWVGNKSKKNFLYEHFKEIIQTQSKNLSIEEFEQKLRPLILDECVASERLIEKLKNEGFDGEFLGRGLSDPQVAAKTEEKNGILVTEDSEFYESRRKIEPRPCFVRKDDSIDNMVLLIKRHMSDFMKSF